MWGKLGGLLAVADAAGSGTLTRTADEQSYVEFEQRFRGTESEIEIRISRYLEYLQGKSRVLDLGCGRGEALEFLQNNGIANCGIDSSAEMIKICREKGLEAKQGDLLEELAALDEESLGGIVSFHVIEHLPPEAVARLVRLAWRALTPSGVLILETPNPLALVVGARNFWLDPTHLRPVHPDGLELLFSQVGFVDVEMIPLHPFGPQEELPELDLAGLSDETKVLATRVRDLRDHLNNILFGHQDYGMLGLKQDVDVIPSQGKPNGS